VVLPEAVALLAEDRDADVVGGAVVGDGRAEGDVESRPLGPGSDLIAPVTVDLAG